MITERFADQFVDRWTSAWRFRDVERLLPYYADDVEICSPYLANSKKTPEGVLRGKEAIASYWRGGLRRVPDFKLQILYVACGVNTLTIVYQAVLDRVATEVFFFNEQGLVEREISHYEPLTLESYC